MNLELIGGLVVLVVSVIAYLKVKNHIQKRLLAEKEQEIIKERTKAAALAKELDNAQQRKKINEASARLDADGVDEQLHTHGYFRD
ncbi:DUF2681 domain-containing protein [Pasteurellaceae bacterium HPA106]|uniref:DUF2681 domain-containing protein n=1 Tax=Spirabiliibacterium pneumoniae TaxID=221400 RepID=UPI001AAC5054|nr:DUF2681 domain-containing protein [Spirabiliibacterium pneumoniae]MBE2896754.1 DUF2681 domain-containing protein [Spirabiliibacterium pneumoniae]